MQAEISGECGMKEREAKVYAKFRQRKLREEHTCKTKTQMNWQYYSASYRNRNGDSFGSLIAIKLSVK